MHPFEEDEMTALEWEVMEEGRKERECVKNVVKRKTKKAMSGGSCLVLFVGSVVRSTKVCVCVFL